MDCLEIKQVNSYTKPFKYGIDGKGNGKFAEDESFQAGIQEFKEYLSNNVTEFDATLSEIEVSEDGLTIGGSNRYDITDPALNLIPNILLSWMGMRGHSNFSQLPMWSRVGFLETYMKLAQDHIDNQIMLNREKRKKQGRGRKPSLADPTLHFWTWGGKIVDVISGHYSRVHPLKLLLALENSFDLRYLMMDSNGIHFNIWASDEAGDKVFGIYNHDREDRTPIHIEWVNPKKLNGEKKIRHIGSENKILSKIIKTVKYYMNR